METRSERFLRERSSVPVASANMANAVSQYRKQQLSEEVARGLYREAGSPVSPNNNDGGLTTAGLLTSTSLNKFAQSGAAGVSGAGTFRGSGGTVRQVPEIYSPLWLTSNLNLPRDRSSINSWCRSYFTLNPIVRNALSLHSTYPISKLSITCKNPKDQQFFDDMNEDLGLMNICVQMAQEYWMLGEAVVYAELDESSATWSRLLIQNPDYVSIQHSVIAGEPNISLRPDENLKRIVTSNRPADILQRRKLDKSIIEHIKRGENIPLSNFNVSYIGNKISPYDLRGTGLVVSCFRQLMLFDLLRESKFSQAYNLINPLTLIKIGSENYKPQPADLEAWRDVFECHDEETEVLTDQGFKKFDEVIEFSEAMDGTYNVPCVSNVVPRPGYKIACFNSDNEQLEYHAPTAAHVYNYNGEMYCFQNDKVDIKVTPNHKMWVQRKRFKGTSKARTSHWGEWEKIEAKDLKFFDRRLRGAIEWKGDDSVKFVDVIGKKIPIELYLEFLGYVLSEGCVFGNNGHWMVSICQTTTNKGGTTNEHYTVMRECIEKFAKLLNSKCYTYIKPQIDNYQELWTGKIFSKKLYNFFKEEVGNENGTKSYHKSVPRWILNLSPRLLNILLEALVRGDGSKNNRKINKDIIGYSYYSTSKQLTDDVYEIVYKCGNVPTMFKRDSYNYLYKYGTVDIPRRILYTIMWSNSNVGRFPLLNKYCVDPRTKEKTNLVSQKYYNGKVWCFTVPTGLFVTRRNGKITIQGNSSQYDKDFKIFTHEAVTVERVGANSAIIDTAPDITQLLKEIYIGLLIPQVLMDGGSDVTYANGGVTLDVLKQRYMQFRNLMAYWLRTKIFAPIAKINEFYDYVEGELVLRVPEVEWNHMSLFDTTEYINILSQLTTGESKEASVQTLFKSLGLDWEDEKRKMREEAIFKTIMEKEKEALDTLPLDDLRALGPEDEIREPIEEAVPGEEVPGEEGMDEELGGLDMPELGGMPPMEGGGGEAAPEAPAE
jgi:hypothetical protein